MRREGWALLGAVALIGVGIFLYLRLDDEEPSDDPRPADTSAETDAGPPEDGASDEARADAGAGAQTVSPEPPESPLDSPELEFEAILEERRDELRVAIEQAEAAGDQARAATLREQLSRIEEGLETPLDLPEE